MEGSNQEFAPNLEAQLRESKLQAEIEKIRLETEELRRSYLTRNPQAITALIQAVAIIIGAIILWLGNYYQTLRTGIEVAKQQSEALDRESRERAQQASARAEAAEQEARSKEATVRMVQERLEALQNRTTSAAARLKTMEGQNTELLVERDLLPMNNLLKDLYQAGASDKLVQELEKVPIARRTTVLDRLFKINKLELANPSPDPVERETCLSAVLLGWTGDSKWLKNLEKATANYLTAKRTPNLGGCIGTCYRNLPSSYDSIRRELLQRVFLRLDAVRVDDSAMTPTWRFPVRMPPGWDYASVVEIPHPTSPKRASDSTEYIRWKSLFDYLFIPSRDLESVPAEIPIEDAIDQRPYYAQTYLTTYRSRDGREATGSFLSLPGYFDEMFFIVFMRSVLANSNPQSLVDRKYSVFFEQGQPPRDVIRLPIGRRIQQAEPQPIVFTLGEWDSMATWLKRNPQTVTLLANGSPGDISKRLSRDQVVRLFRNEWIEDANLLPIPLTGVIGGEAGDRPGGNRGRTFSSDPQPAIPQHPSHR